MIMFDYSCYIASLISFLKCAYPKLKIHKFYNLPKNVYGRVSYKQNWIKLDCPTSKLALFTLIHEGGHYLSYQKNKTYGDFEKVFTTKHRENLAYLYGWGLIIMMGLNNIITKKEWIEFKEL